MIEAFLGHDGARLPRIHGHSGTESAGLESYARPWAANGSVTEEQVESAFRQLVHVHHPDKGGDPELFHRLIIARENARRDLGITR